MSFQGKKLTEWQKLASEWSKFKPPYKPSIQRIKLYRQLIQKYCRGNKALLLGATPEIRDLLYRLNFQVTIFDFSPAAVKAMTTLRKTKSREKIVIGDWLKKNIKEKFDLIIGDIAINQLKPSDYTKFFRKMCNFLNESGVLLQEIGGRYNKKTIKPTIKRLVKRVKTNPTYFKNFANRTYEHILFWLKFRKNGMVDSGQVEDWITTKTLGRLNKREQKLLKVGLYWQGSCLDTKEIEKAIKPVFKILVKKIEAKHKVYQNFYRLYVLKKK